MVSTLTVKQSKYFSGGGGVEGLANPGFQDDQNLIFHGRGDFNTRYNWKWNFPMTRSVGKFHFIGPIEALILKNSMDAKLGGEMHPVLLEFHVQWKWTKSIYRELLLGT